MVRNGIHKGIACALLALSLGLFPALRAQGDPPPVLTAIQPIGKDSSQPIGKDSLQFGVAAHTVLLHCPHPTVTVSGSFLSDLGGTAFASAKGTQYRSFTLSTDYTGPLSILSLSFQEPFSTPWLPSASTLTANSPVTFTWQPDGAFIGQADGLDFNGKPEFVRGGLFIDPDTLQDPVGFNQSTFTLTFTATPEPGAGVLIAAIAFSASPLLLLRRRRSLRTLRASGPSR